MKGVVAAVHGTDVSTVLRSRPYLVDISEEPPIIVGECRWVTGAGRATPVGRLNHGMIEWRRRGR